MKLTRKEYVAQLAKALKGDGCTDVPDLFFTPCCDEHDIHYRTGNTITGKPITRLQADNQFFKCMRKHGKTPVIGKLLLPALYWVGVRIFGGKAFLT